MWLMDCRSRYTERTCINRKHGTTHFQRTFRSVRQTVYSYATTNFFPAIPPRTGGIAYTVQAVIADIPQNTTLGFLKTIEALTLNDSEGIVSGEMRQYMQSGYSFALLHREVDRNQFIASWKEKPIKWHSTITDNEEIITAEPFGYFDWRNQGANYFAWITLITGVLVLLVGLINFFHSLTGSFLTRFHEYGIRRVNGANEKSLFSLLFIQAILLVSASGLITLICIEILSPFLGFSLFNFSIHIDKKMLMEQTFIYLFYLLFIAAIVCFCITVKIRKTNLQESLFGGSRRYGQHKLRNILLYIQLFICWIFLSLGTALYLLSWETSKGLFPSLSSTEKESIVSIPLDYTFMANSDKQMLINKFRQLPGVKDILLADISYMDGASSTGLFTEKDNPDSFMQVNVINISPNFFKFMHIDLLSGKSVSTTNEAIVDKKLAKKLGSEVLGKTYYNYSDAYTVMGVCETFTTYLHAESPGYLFRFYENSDYIGHCYVKCEPDRVQEVEDGIKEIMKSVLPENLSWQPASLMDDIRNHQAFHFTTRSIFRYHPRHGIPPKGNGDSKDTRSKYMANRTALRKALYLDADNHSCFRVYMHSNYFALSAQNVHFILQRWFFVLWKYIPDCMYYHCFHGIFPYP